MLISVSSGVWALSDEETSIRERTINGLVVRVFMLEQGLMELESRISDLAPIEEDQIAAEVQPTSVLMVDIYDEQKDFNDNDFATLQKYYNKLVEVGGGEIEITKSRLLGGFPVRLSTPTDLEYSVVFSPEQDIQDVVDISIRDIVTVKGTGKSSIASDLDMKIELL